MRKDGLRVRRLTNQNEKAILCWMALLVLRLKFV
jgi:hypothetical protein